MIVLSAIVLGLIPPAEAEEPGHGPSLLVQPERVVFTRLKDGRQLLVSTVDEGGSARDSTLAARYVVEPEGSLDVTARGYVRPVRHGRARLTIEHEGLRKVLEIEVSNRDDSRPVHFTNDIEPILTRYGCNAGGCHGKASGQNGFRLSLFGYDAVFDHTALVKEGRGRRLFPAAPERSLLLTKPTGEVPHGGGRKFDRDSEAYELIRRWIAQGASLGGPDAPTLKKLEVLPGRRILDRQSRQQLAVLARYSDGGARDVTRQAQFQSNDPSLAAVDDDGLVRTFDRAGEAAVMARYMGQVAIFRAIVPLSRQDRADRSPGDDAHFVPAGFIDELALSRWRELGLSPSQPSTDAEFLRRVRLDLCGKLPQPEEVRAFLADRSPDKRARLIDRCLADDDYAAYFALKWGTILRNAASSGMKAGGEPAAYAFSSWLRDMIARNRPYDELVREIITASGDWSEAPAVQWFYQMSDDPLHQPTADTAQIFLGLRLQCARCHHHPFERWSQDDYYGLAGFYGRLATKSFEQGPPVYFSERQPTTSELNPRTGKTPQPKPLDRPPLEIPAGEDPRKRLADWMTRPDNPFLARALVNRVWGHLFGRGIVEPVDDMRETNPPSNPELLDALAREFIAHRFDVKHLIRTICNSRTYQLSCSTSQGNEQDQQNFARYYGKRLIAEVLLDVIDQATGTKTTFNKVSDRARAVDLPHEAFDSYFLDVFDRPRRVSACECARSGSASLTQVLHLANSPDLEDKIASDTGRAARLAREKVPSQKAVEELYLATLSRFPTESERARAAAHLGRGSDPRWAVEDVLWSLINSKEFLFNH
jgi:hypothetical protein